MATIPVQAVCNTFLMKAFQENVSVSPMKLQKLLYFTYRDYLKKNNDYLFSEKFEVWPYGPVLSSVYNEFSSFHGNPIRKFARNADGSVTVVSNDVYDVMASIQSVWHKYRNKTGIELSNITHMDGSAWRKANSRGDHFLSDVEIREETVE